MLTFKWSEETAAIAEKLYQLVVCGFEVAAPLVRERPFIRIETGGTPRPMTGKTEANFKVTRNICRESLPLLWTDNIPKMCP